MAQSLWGTIPDVKKLRTPYAILVEQAEALKAETNGLLVGKVSRESANDQFTSILQIVAPNLNNYTYSVLKITHGISLYPVTIFPFESKHVKYTRTNETDFINTLAEVLRSPKVRRVVTGLLSQIVADIEVRNR